MLLVCLFGAGQGQKDKGGSESGTRGRESCSGSGWRIGESRIDGGFFCLAEGGVISKGMGNGFPVLDPASALAAESGEEGRLAGLWGGLATESREIGD